MSQLGLDLEGATIESQWNELAHKEARNWTDKALCIGWVCPGVDWRNNEDWWDALPKYKQAYYLSLWSWNQARIDQGLKGYDFATVEGLIDDAIKVENGRVERWATLIREAAMRGQPVPIVPHPRDDHLLERACRMAGVLVVGGAA